SAPMVQSRQPPVIRAVPATWDEFFSRWTACPGTAFWAREAGLQCPANSLWSSASCSNRKVYASVASGWTCETLSIGLGKPVANLPPPRICGYRESSTQYSVFRWTCVSLYLKLVTVLQYPYKLYEHPRPSEDFRYRDDPTVGDAAFGATLPGA